MARIPLSEVRGRAGLWESAFHDVVVVLDESGSTFAASGSDIDGDGSVHTPLGAPDVLLHLLREGEVRPPEVVAPASRSGSPARSRS